MSFTNATSVANSTFDSGLIAARYGAHYSGRNFSRYNFTYSVYDGGSNVSGPSAGAAMTLLAISAFENKPLKSDLTITGTISPDGTIGQIGGAIDKVAAASAAGLRFVLVPRVAPGSIEEGAYFIAQTEYHLPLIEVSNVSQAAGYEFGNLDGAGKGITVNFSENYTVGNLTQALLNCSNSCDETPFAALANYTINLTRSEILNLSALPGFGGAAGQLINDTYQAYMIHQAGYVLHIGGHSLPQLSRRLLPEQLQHEQDRCPGLHAERPDGLLGPHGAAAHLRQLRVRHRRRAQAGMGQLHDKLHAGRL